MIVLGLAGKAGSGKDTVALYLQERYGFIPFSFSDALYAEVATAFGLENEDLLRDRETKEVPSELLNLSHCTNREFHVLMFPRPVLMPNSPRQILQWWGTEYRRAADPDYWVRAARRWVTDVRAMYPRPELRPQHFVNCSVRFENEREMILYTAYYETDDGTQWEGNIWHLHRDAAPSVNPHESETALPVLDGERVIHNNYTLEYLHMGIDQLMSSNIPSIRIEPPEPMVKPEEYTRVYTGHEPREPWKAPVEELAKQTGETLAVMDQSRRNLTGEP